MPDTSSQHFSYSPCAHTEHLLSADLLFLKNGIILEKRPLELLREQPLDRPGRRPERLLKDDNAGAFVSIIPSCFGARKRRLPSTAQTRRAGSQHDPRGVPGNAAHEGSNCIFKSEQSALVSRSSPPTADITAFHGRRATISVSVSGGSHQSVSSSRTGRNSPAALAAATSGPHRLRKNRSYPSSKEREPRQFSKLAMRRIGQTPFRLDHAFDHPWRVTFRSLDTQTCTHVRPVMGAPVVSKAQRSTTSQERLPRFTMSPVMMYPSGNASQTYQEAYPNIIAQIHRNTTKNQPQTRRPGNINSHRTPSKVQTNPTIAMAPAIAVTRMNMRLAVIWTRQHCLKAQAEADTVCPARGEEQTSRSCFRRPTETAMWQATPQCTRMPASPVEVCPWCVYFIEWLRRQGRQAMGEVVTFKPIFRVSVPGGVSSGEQAVDSIPPTRSPSATTWRPWTRLF